MRTVAKLLYVNSTLIVHIRGSIISINCSLNVEVTRTTNVRGTNYDKGLWSAKSLKKILNFRCLFCIVDIMSKDVGDESYGS